MTSRLPSWLDELSGDIATREVICERAKNIKGSLTVPTNVQILLPDCIYIGEINGFWQFNYKGNIFNLYLVQIKTNDETSLRQSLTDWCCNQLDRNGLLHVLRKSSNLLQLKHTSFEDLVGIFVGK